jgi:hypothetical protein
VTSTLRKRTAHLTRSVEDTTTWPPHTTGYRIAKDGLNKALRAPRLGTKPHPLPRRLRIRWPRLVLSLEFFDAGNRCRDVACRMSPVVPLSMQLPPTPTPAAQVLGDAEKIRRPAYKLALTGWPRKKRIVASGARLSWWVQLAKPLSVSKLPAIILGVCRRPHCVVVGVNVWLAPPRSTLHLLLESITAIVFQNARVDAITRN